jgi:hypothetical protein
MLTLATSDSFEDHIESVHGSYTLAPSFPVSTFSPGLFDYIAFIAMIILKDHSTLSGIFFPPQTDIPRAFCNSFGRTGVCSVQLHCRRDAVWRDAQGQARHDMATVQGTFPVLTTLCVFASSCPVPGCCIADCNRVCKQRHPPSPGLLLRHVLLCSLSYSAAGGVADGSPFDTEVVSSVQSCTPPPQPHFYPG